MAIYRGSGGANEATDAATNQAAAAAEYARQASESALDTQALYDTFDDTYLGSKASAPTLDNDGDDLSIGALYFDSVENKLKVYSDIGWIDSAVASPSSFTSQAFSGTGVQTVFTLSTAPSSIQSLLVFVSGLRLRPTLDYTVSSTTLTFAVAPANATNNISVLVVTTLAVGTPDDNSISTAKIQNGVVTLDKLAADSVDSSKIVNGTIVVGDLNASVLVASNVTNAPAGNIVATNVQTALNELDTEKVSAGSITTSGLTQNTNKILGRSTASVGTIEELTIGSGLTLASGTITSSPTFASQSDYITGTDTTKALNSVILRANNLVLGTAIATTSGTSHDFTSIPSWVKRITFTFSGVSASGTSPYLIQIGDAGGIENTGYAGAVMDVSAAAYFSAGFTLQLSIAAAQTQQGTATLVRHSGNTWAISGGVSGTSSGFINTFYGVKTLSADLDRVRLTTTNGTDTFDAGSFNILYE